MPNTTADRTAAIAASRCCEVMSPGTNTMQVWTSAQLSRWLRPREEAREDRLHADAREPHRDLHVVARALPAAHLADAERWVAQLCADLQAAAPVLVVVLDADLTGRVAARGRATRRGQRQARARRLIRVISRPAPAPRALPLAVPVRAAVFGRPRHHDRLHARRGQIAQEAAGDAGELLPRQPTPAHTRQQKLRARARHRDVAEAPLLLDGRIVVDAARVGEDPLLEIGRAHV